MYTQLGTYGPIGTTAAVVGGAISAVIKSRNAPRLMTLTNQILSTARSEVGKLKDQHKRQTLLDDIREFEDEFRPWYDKNKDQKRPGIFARARKYARKINSILRKANKSESKKFDEDIKDISTR